MSNNGTGPDQDGECNPFIDLARLSEIYGERDRNELFRILGWFVDGFPEQLAALDAALEARDASALEDAAHAAKSAAINAAAPRLTALARLIERDAGTGDWESLTAAVGEARSEFDRIAGFCRNRPGEEA